jgi:hypothetical protein
VNLVEEEERIEAWEHAGTEAPAKCDAGAILTRLRTHDVIDLADRRGFPRRGRPLARQQECARGAAHEEPSSIEQHRGKV